VVAVVEVVADKQFEKPAGSRNILVVNNDNAMIIRYLLLVGSGHPYLLTTNASLKGADYEQDYEK